MINFLILIFSFDIAFGNSEEIKSRTEETVNSLSSELPLSAGASFFGSSDLCFFFFFSAFFNCFFFFFSRLA
jgi:hypothetical protein